MMCNNANQISLRQIIEENYDSQDEELHIIEQSEYVDDQKLIDVIQSKTHFFKCLSINIQSLNAKIDELRIYIENLKRNHCEFDAICIQETWVKDIKENLGILQIDDYRLVMQDCQCSSHSGLAIYIKENLKYEILNVKTRQHVWEAQFLKVSMANEQYLILGNIYRPPKQNAEIYETFLTELDCILKSWKGDVLIGGDFNVDLLKIDEKPQNKEFFDIILNNGYIPKVTLPTRFSRMTGSLIDNFLCKKKRGFSETTCRILSYKLSDHQPYFICLDFAKPNTKCQKYVKVTDYSNKNVAAFKSFLNSENIMQKLVNVSSQDPNYTYDIFNNILQKGMDLHIPTKIVKFNKHKHKQNAWITKGLIISIKYRDRLYQKLKKTGCDNDSYAFMKSHFKSYNKVLRKAIKEAKQIYYRKMFEMYKNDAKNTWITIKNVLKNPQNKSKIPKFMNIDNSEIMDRQIIADKFNSYFTKIGDTISSEIVPEGQQSDFKDYLENFSTNAFTFKNVTEEEILKIISDIKSKKSFGLDRISSTLLKQIKQEIYKPITIIVNQSIETGIFPDQLKIAKVIPIYKKGEKTLIENYRPISILPTVSKIIEKVIFKQIHQHFQSNDLYHASQYGFRESHSTELAVLEIIDRIVYSMDAGNVPINIFMDMSKAFDTINHKILIEKLKHYGFHGKQLQLIINYFTNRKQYVEIDGNKSSLLPINTGVPQGSILGPLFFIIYINDISISSKIFKFVTYADDTTLILAIKYENKELYTPIESKINMELQNINVWLKLNKLSLNISKTKCMIFHKPQKKIVKPCIEIENKQIEYVDNFSLLGIIVDKNLNWSAHMTYIGKKISKTNCILMKLRHYLTKPTLKAIYNALINSHLNYGILCWGYNSTHIQKLQKKSIRIICQCEYNAHTEPLFKQLYILKVSDILIRKLYKFYFKLYNHHIPKYYLQTQFLFIQSQSHSYNTRNAIYTKPKISHKFTEFTLRYQLPSELNKKIDDILEKTKTHSEFGFSAYVKNYIISKYKTDCNIPNCYNCNK
jgi:hypothetical protein